MSIQNAFYNFSRSPQGLEPAVIRATQIAGCEHLFTYVSLRPDETWRVWTGNRNAARLEEEETGALVLRVAGLLPHEYCTFLPRESDFYDAREGMYSRMCFQLGVPEYE